MALGRRHPYDDGPFIQGGRGLWRVNGHEFEAGPATSWSRRFTCRGSRSIRFDGSKI
jgi:hypothetical protein